MRTVRSLRPSDSRSVRPSSAARAAARSCAKAPSGVAGAQHHLALGSGLPKGLGQEWQSLGVGQAPRTEGTVGAGERCRPVARDHVLVPDAENLRMVPEAPGLGFCGMWCPGRFKAAMPGARNPFDLAVADVDRNHLHAHIASEC